jgi:dTDP-D-glucose 4,6-dehydratase
MILNAMEGKPPPVYGDGSNVRERMDHSLQVVAARSFLDDARTVL